ncbi:helix-turn-helix domain-containing protein [Paenibacillus luteus]|uniref:helix-turn-helix domain-containing protein n=1 Tax=Paenibacillus luteus TaxID=2545753 RepID=UPI0011426307|nr:ABC transporter substrate-binding protein [Paenibacillus luteus]
MKTNQYVLREARSVVLKFPDPSKEMVIQAPALFLLGEGHGVMEMNDQQYELSFGCLLFAHGGANVVISSSGQSDLHLYMIQFTPYKLMEDTQDRLFYQQDGEGLPSNGLIATNRFGVLIGLFKAIIEDYESEATENPLEGQRLLLELLQEVLITNRQIPQYNHATPIQKAIHYIKENYNTKLERPFLAHLTGYHPHYLSKQFHKETGKSLSDYILQIRIDKAKELLSITSSHINEIASEVGYADALYFSRKFKQATGGYPTEFRQSPKRIVAFQYIGTLLALGITPVGVDARLVRHSQLLRSELADIPSFEEWESHKVRMLQPDIIVAPNYFRADQLRQLREIAPVITQSWEEISPLERMRMIGQIVGKQREAENWIYQFNHMAGQLRRKLEHVIEAGETVAAYEIADGNVYALSRQDRGAYALYDALGCTPPAALKQNVLDVGKSKIISLEELPGYAADHMVVSIYDEAGMENTNRLLASEMWQQLPAVRKNRMYSIPVNKWFSNDGVSLQKLTVLLAQLFLSQ